jgi:hypothetical protein
MAHRFIIDDQTGQLYKDFTGRRLTSAAEILKSERGLTPTLEFYLINVATDTGAVTAQTLTNAQLSVAIGSASTPPDSGFIKASFTQSGTLYESEQLNIESLTAASLESAFNSSIQPVYNVGGLTVDQIGPGKWLLTMKKVGAITGSPSLNVENSDPPTGVEVTSVTTGDSDTRAQWIISLAQLPVASIAGGSFSAVTSGSFSGLSSSIALNTTGMLAAIARDIKLFEFSVIHNNQVLHRSTVEINESLDPTAAGTVVVTSPSLFTLGSNAVNQGETIALSGGLTYDGTTLAAPFLPLAGGTMTGDALFGQDVKAVFGSTLEIFYDGSHSRIREIGTGELRLQGTNLRLWSSSGENYLTATENGAVSLYYDSVKKFETTSLGCTISGKLIVNGDLDVSGTTTTFNSTVVTVDDPVFTVGGDTAPVASDNKDRGIEFRYFRSGESAKVGFFGYDNSEDAFTLLTDATNNSEVFSGTLGSIKVGGGTVTGTLYVGDSIDHWGDGGTGLSFPSNDVVAFKTSGTEAARFDSSGHFLVNTTTSSADVFQSVATDARYAGRFTGSEISGSSFGLRVRAGYISSDLPLLVENRSGTDLFKVKGDGSSHFNSQTTNTVATFESTDPGAGILLADDTGTSKLETSGAELRVSCDDDDTVNNSVIKFRLDGATKATLSSTGLGIGGSPSKKLHVKDGSSGFSGSFNARTQAIIESDNSSGTALSILNPSSGNGAIYFGDNSEEYSGQISYTHTGDVMKFATGATVRMNLNSTGLGIGGAPLAQTYIESDNNSFAATGTPSNYHLVLRNPQNDLSEGVGIGFTSSTGTDSIGAAIAFERTGNQAQGDLVFSAKSSTSAGASLDELLRLDGSTGNVSIGGVTSPSYPLVVKSTSATHQIVAVNRPDSDTAALFLGNNSGLNGIISANNSDLLFGKDFGNTFFEGFRLDTNGHLRVGNGTRIYLWRDNNQNYLNYNTWLATTGAEQLIENNGTGGIHLKASGTDSDIVFSASDGTLNELMRLDGSTGNVGIGGVTSPATKLVIDNGGVGTVDSGYSLAILGDGIDGVQIISSSSNQGRIVFGDDSSNAIGRLNYDHSNDSMSFVTNGSETMRIDASGNVGINCTPSRLLEISDSTQATGAILRLSNTASGSTWTTGDTIGTLEFYSSDPSAAGNKALIEAVQLTGSSNLTYPSLVGLDFYASTNNVTDLAVRISPSTLRIHSAEDKSWSVGDKVASLEFFSADQSGSGPNSVRSEINLVTENTFGSAHSLSFATRADVSGSPTEKAKITSSGDMELVTDDKGLILSSANGTRYRITVANDGTVTSTAV